MKDTFDRGGATAHLKNEHEVKRALQSSLDANKRSASFAAHGVWEANPGLEIERPGRFGSPLMVHDIERLSKFARHPPFATDTETATDDNAPRVLQVDASRFKLRHPKWLH